MAFVTPVPPAYRGSRSLLGNTSTTTTTTTQRRRLSLVANLRRCTTAMSPRATVATDEMEAVIRDELQLGAVTSITRCGASGWAVMHRATTDKGHRLFIKTSREDVAMFEGEAAGLSAMHDTNSILVPKVHHCAELSGLSGSYIIMQQLDMVGIFDMAQLGMHLAKMHLAPPVLPEARDGQYGFCVDNTIGGTPQPNGWVSNWVDFFRDRRLLHQALLTGDSKLIEKSQLLAARLPELFTDVSDSIRPSLLHGDLWNGNVDGVENEPVIFDPACYYGHHEAEFGMSWCMSLSDAFWDEYRKLIPKADGFERRLKLYKLYHYLNHYNLFGGGYYAMADLLLSDLLNSL